MYVIWSPCATTYNGHINMLHIVTQLFERGGKGVGNGKWASAAGKASYPFAPTPTEEDELKAMRDATDHVAKEIGQKTGMAK